MIIAKFHRADIVLIRPKPGSPKAASDVSHALIITPAAYNQTGTAVIVPILNDGEYGRFGGFSVSLDDTEMETKGVVLSNLVQSINLDEMDLTYIESVPQHIIEDVLARITTLFA